MRQVGTNYYSFLKEIERISLSHPLVNSFITGKYKLNSDSNTQYPVIAYTFNDLQYDVVGNSSTHSVSINILYADRLTHDRSNLLEIQSTGISTLQEIVNKMNEELYTYTISSARLQLFKEQFSDSTAGAFIQITITYPSDLAWCDYFCYEKEC